MCVEIVLQNNRDSHPVKAIIKYTNSITLS